MVRRVAVTCHVSRGETHSNKEEPYIPVVGCYACDYM